jgi:lipocalin
VTCVTIGGITVNVFGAFVFLASFLLGAQHGSAQATSTSPLTAVDNVDLRRYAGKWYEIARYPNRFQRNCQSDTTAIYTLRDDGKVQVVNACREKSGKVTTARGTAKVVDNKDKCQTESDILLAVLRRLLGHWLEPRLPVRDCG